MLLEQGGTVANMQYGRGGYVWEGNGWLADDWIRF